MKKYGSIAIVFWLLSIVQGVLGLVGILPSLWLPVFSICLLSAVGLTIKCITLTGMKKAGIDYNIELRCE